jgi:hypothetical protein
MLDSVGHIRLDDVSAIGSSIEEMETTMKFIVDVEFSDEIMTQAAEYGNRFTEQDRIHYLENKIEDGLEGDYYDSVTATMQVEEDPDRFIASEEYVAQVMAALEYHTPNAPEEWVAEAVQALANYLLANDYVEVDMYNTGEMYTMYDLLKWTLANK